MIVCETGTNIGRVIMQGDHTDLSHQFACAFGNDVFDAPEPRSLMEFVTLHHDRGWDEVDANISRNPDTGLPYSLVNTPFDQLLASGPGSVEFNSAHHPYCGLISSMHIWGLYNGRYGLSDKIVIDMLSGDTRARADEMLAAEIQRQDFLKLQLAHMEECKDWVEDKKIFQNYKQLQFFDTLSLYFNGVVGDSPENSEFLNVPKNRYQDVTIKLEPLSKGVYRLDPFPFSGSELVVNLKVTQVPVFDHDVDYREVFRISDFNMESIKLVV